MTDEEDNFDNLTEGFIDTKDLVHLDGCPLCNHPEIARRYQRNYVLGKTTKKKFMQFFNCNFDTIANHMMFHDDIVRKEVGKEDKWEIKTDGNFYKNNLLSSLSELDDLKDLLITGGRADPNVIKAIVTLMKEIRDTLKDIAIAKGQINQNDQKITINVDKINQNYLSLTQIITSECCGSCQKKVIAKMEEMNLLN